MKKFNIYDNAEITQTEGFSDDELMAELSDYKSEQFELRSEVDDEHTDEAQKQFNHYIYEQFSMLYEQNKVDSDLIDAAIIDIINYLTDGEES